MNKKLLNLKNIGVPVVVVLLIILGIIFLLSKNNPLSTPLISNPSLTTVEDSDITLLPVENLNQVKLADSVISFNEPYFVNTVVQARSVSGIKCGTSENDSCIINFITDESSTFHISTPFEPMAEDGLNKEAIAKTFETVTGTVYLKYKIIDVVNEAGEKIPEESLTAQIYGCIKNNICVGSGILDISTKVANTQQVTKFEDFVKSLNIQ